MLKTNQETIEDWVCIPLRISLGVMAKDKKSSNVKLFSSLH